jgi:DnaJ-class molecular chaperone
MTTTLRTVCCRACEGSGKFWRHRPFPDDPYFMEETRDECPDCDGLGVTAAHCEACGDPLMPSDEDLCSACYGRAQYANTRIDLGRGK